MIEDKTKKLARRRESGLTPRKNRAEVLAFPGGPEPMLREQLGKLCEAKALLWKDLKRQQQCTNETRNAYLHVSREIDVKFARLMAGAEILAG